MDINLELYKVFYYVATTLSFSEASKTAFYLTVCSKPGRQKPWKKSWAILCLCAAPNGSS